MIDLLHDEIVGKVRNKWQQQIKSTKQQMIPFIATFLTIIAAAAVLLGGWLAGGFVRHQLREASKVNGSRQQSVKTTIERTQTRSIASA